MKIAQIAPLYESVPPKTYGGTERVASYLTEALIEAGHEVTLYASADSVTAAELRPGCRRALRFDEENGDSIASHVLMIERVSRDAHEFDVVHSHIDYLPFPVFRHMDTPHVTTLHGRLDIASLPALYREFKEMPVVSISRAQRSPIPHANWVGNVYHGLPKDLYEFHEEGKGYLAFIGRISPEKRVDIAIEIATRAGMPLRIAAKVDKVDVEYFDEKIRPLLKRKNVEFIGEIGDKEKNDFIGNADALLFPIDWPEPFGLVMIEAVACGTPIIAFPRGSVPEVMEEGVTGFVVPDLEAAVSAVSKIKELSRRECRNVFEKRFTSERMAADYVRIYAQAGAGFGMNGARSLAHGKNNTG